MRSSDNIKHIPILPAETQLALVSEWQNHSNEKSLERLILSNMKAIYKEAGKIKSRNKNISYDDLVQEGIAGLLKAANKFDSEQSVTFLTYALWWVRANMKRHVMDYRSVVRMGTTRDDRKLFSNLSKTLREAEEEGLNGEDKYAKVAEKLGVKQESVEQMATALKGFDVRLDTPVSNDVETLKVDMLEDKASLKDAVCNNNESSYLSEALNEIIKQLPHQERVIVEKRFFAENPMTLRELALTLNISREWVRKLESKALDRIRKRLASSFDIRSL